MWRLIKRERLARKRLGMGELRLRLKCLTDVGRQAPFEQGIDKEFAKHGTTAFIAKDVSQGGGVCRYADTVVKT